MPPSLKQIKLYLRKVLKVDSKAISKITEQNVTAKINELTAHSSIVPMKIEPENWALTGLLCILWYYRGYYLNVAWIAKWAIFTFISCIFSCYLLQHSQIYWYLLLNTHLRAENIFCFFDFFLNFSISFIV